MVRQAAYFNTEPQTGQLINGITASLEENIALDGGVSEEMPNNVKATLMGPLAGIGDSLMQGIIVPILLMALGSIANMAGWTGMLKSLCTFFGTPIIALSIGVVFAVLTLSQMRLPSSPG